MIACIKCLVHFMCGNSIPLKTRGRGKALLSCSTRKPGAFLWRTQVDCGFFFPSLVESEPDLAVCKHLALSQKRLILQYPTRAVQTVGLKRTCFSLN